MDTVSEAQDCMFTVPTYNIKPSSIGWWLNNGQYTKQSSSTGTSNTYTTDTSVTEGGFYKLTENHPLVIRFVGRVYGPEGITAYDSAEMGGSTGDNGSMARMRNLRNVTLEGVGSDAIIDGWGFHFICGDTTAQRGRNFELRNVKFYNVPEDCVGMEGQQEGSTITAPVERCWVHHCEFYGPTISNPAESDKDGGDGACDFKRGNYFTNSYCYYEGYHKTNLVGSSDDSLQYHLTYHHNYWVNCEARGPLTRNANVHMYNNVFAGQSSYAMNPRADSYIFSEYNMFYMVKNPMQVKAGGIKSYNDVFASAIGDQQGTIVTDKSQKVNTNCLYANFDTNSSVSYIPSNDYFLQTDLTEVRKTLYISCGTQKDTKLTLDQVTMADISFLPKNVTPVEVTSTPTTLTPGKISKTVYAFKLNNYATVKADVDGSTSILCNEAGVVVAKDSSEVVLAPGIYMIQPVNFQPGGDANNQFGIFKEFTCNSVTINPYDSEELNQQRIDEYNKLVSQIANPVVYNDSCGAAIKAAKNYYNTLGDLQAEVNYTTVDTAYKQYIALGKAEVEGLISSIGSVNETSGTKIVSARTAYDKLKAYDSTVTISNYSTLQAAEAAYQSYAVNACIGFINDIGTVTLSSGEKIALARAAYDSLSSTQQAQVNNYQTLVNAEAEYNDLAKVQEVEELIQTANTLDSYKAAVNAYEALTASQQTKVTGNIDNVYVQYTIALINSIGEVTAEDRETVETAEAVYESLSSTNQDLVTNYQTLVDARATLNEKLAGEYTITFNASAPVGDTDFYTVAGEYKNKTALKLQSSKGSIEFTTTGPATLTIEFASSSSATTVKVNGTEYEISGSTVVITLDSAGTYTITRGSGEAHVSSVTVSQ